MTISSNVKNTAYGNDVGEITIVDLGKGENHRKSPANISTKSQFSLNFFWIIQTKKGLKPANKIEEQQLAKKQTKRSKRWVESKTRIVHEGWVSSFCFLIRHPLNACAH